MGDLNTRMVYLQSWWLASELIRRHPHLHLIQTHPVGGMADCLTVVDQRVPPSGAWPDGEVVVDLNRSGTIHVRGQSGFMEFEAERSLGDRHGALKRIEGAAGLVAPHSTPASTPFALTLRVIYRFLALVLNEKEQWVVHNQRVDSDALWSQEQTTFCDLAEFHTARESLSIEQRDDPLGDRRYHFWVLGESSSTSDFKPRAVLDTDGHVHLPNGRFNLVEAYEKSDRKITPTLVAALGPLVP